jgi:hypothetical protein
MPHGLGRVLVRGPRVGKLEPLVIGVHVVGSAVGAG